jgi:hypothetical protein
VFRERRGNAEGELVAAVVLSTSASAAPSLTWPVSEASLSCRMVRYALKPFSSDALESMARARGLSEATIQPEAVQSVSGRGYRNSSGKGSAPYRTNSRARDLDFCRLAAARLVTS